MTTPPKPPSGPNLWAGLSLEDVKELIRTDVAEIRRVHLLKAEDDLLPPQRRNIRLRLEVEFWEKAHDLHWQVYREIVTKESKSSQLEAVE